jgi:hypothetical protein
MTEQTALADLLRRAQSAHHEHQVNDLGGKHSEDWPQWYAQFLIDNGMVDFVAGKPKQADLASFLKRSYESFEAAASKGDWVNLVAGELLEHQELHHPATLVEDTLEAEREEDQKDDQGEEDSG